MFIIKSLYGLTVMLRGKKVVILLMDSFGIGAASDAEKFGDVGADTLGHIVDDRAKHQHRLQLPNLAKRGLQKAAELSRKRPLSADLSEKPDEIQAKYGFCIETSSGKDTPSGHWEIAGVPVTFDWHYFTKNSNKSSVFPGDFLEKWLSICQLDQGVLDAGHASGTDVLKALGEKHCKTKQPIIYTSGDSVFQVAAHEQHFGLERLYTICEKARRLLDEMGLTVGRVIARPFVGEHVENFRRTGNRKDYSILPPEKTLLDRLKQAGGIVVSIGKIADIYADQGISKKIKATGIDALFDATLSAYQTAEPNTLIFTNFVDFDSSFGHRRDVEGYANALIQFDARLPELDRLLDDESIVIVTADHGCDPTWVGSDHTREHIPFLLWGNTIAPENIGARTSFADIGQSIADFMGLNKLKYGHSIFNPSRYTR